MTSCGVGVLEGVVYVVNMLITVTSPHEMSTPTCGDSLFKFDFQFSGGGGVYVIRNLHLELYQLVCADIISVLLMKPRPPVQLFVQSYPVIAI